MDLKHKNLKFMPLSSPHVYAHVKIKGGKKKFYGGYQQKENKIKVRPVFRRLKRREALDQLKPDHVTFRGPKLHDGLRPEPRILFSKLNSKPNQIKHVQAQDRPIRIPCESSQQSLASWLLANYQFDYHGILSQSHLLYYILS